MTKLLSGNITRSPTHLTRRGDSVGLVMEKNITIMQTLTVRDLRYDFTKVEAWLADGQEIEITKHGKPVARLSPPGSAKVPKFDIEEHKRRMQETWGDRVFTMAEVREMREAELGDRS